MNFFRLVIFTAAIATAAAQTKAEAGAPFSGREQRYRLQPTDTIEVQYRYTPEYNQSASIQPDGFVSLQLIGSVQLAGLTLEETTARLRELAGERLRSPDLSVILRDYDKPHFVVGGEVANPGRFELRGRITAIEAIAMAGGLKTNSAKHSQVVLFRRIGVDTGETRLLNVKQMMNDRTLREDVSLRPGDMLLVPQNRISKIERFVKWGSAGVYWSPIRQ